MSVVQVVHMTRIGQTFWWSLQSRWWYSAGCVAPHCHTGKEWDWFSAQDHFICFSSALFSLKSTIIIALYSCSALFYNPGTQESSWLATPSLLPHNPALIPTVCSKWALMSIQYSYSSNWVSHSSSYVGLVIIWLLFTSRNHANWKKKH